MKVEPGGPAPVLDGVTGTIGDPVAVAPAPEPTPPAAAPVPEGEIVPVPIGAVPLANPVEPATAVEL